MPMCRAQNDASFNFIPRKSALPKTAGGILRRLARPRLVLVLEPGWRPTRSPDMLNSTSHSPVLRLVSLPNRCLRWNRLHWASRRRRAGRNRVIPLPKNCLVRCVSVWRGFALCLDVDGVLSDGHLYFLGETGRATLGKCALRCGWCRHR